MLSRAIDGAALMGAANARVKLQQDYNQLVIDTIKKGVGRLVDANMNEASTRLKAIQTQQQLSLQALNIANAQPENILQLFR
ncbi:flagellin-like hook-associated protein FlgL [Sinorhizobium fredii]|uniref:flagellin n=1 Tax=Rhizobium fredii TaxID=380 RepID=UPI00351225D8